VFFFARIRMTQIVPVYAVRIDGQQTAALLTFREADAVAFAAAYNRLKLGAASIEAGTATIRLSRPT
jgi:hypothetical protein